MVSCFYDRRKTQIKGSRNENETRERGRRICGENGTNERKV